MKFTFGYKLYFQRSTNVVHKKIIHDYRILHCTTNGPNLLLALMNVLMTSQDKRGVKLELDASSLQGSPSKLLCKSAEVTNKDI